MRVPAQRSRRETSMVVRKLVRGARWSVVAVGLTIGIAGAIAAPSASASLRGVHRLDRTTGRGPILEAAPSARATAATGGRVPAVTTRTVDTQPWTGYENAIYAADDG